LVKARAFGAAARRCSSAPIALRHEQRNSGESGQDMTKQQQIAEMMSRNSVSYSHGLTPPF
jgi:hypothetical protein